jgi:hypothetical protein
MFLERRAADYPGQDNWTFGFLLPGRDQFVFFHEGVQVAELADAVHVSALGSTFYMIHAGRPFTLEQAVADEHVFQACYGFAPRVAFDKYVVLDAVRLDQFFRATAGDWSLECLIVGTHEKDLSHEDLARIVQATIDDPRPRDLADLRLSSLLATHDNSFFSLEAKSLALLRRLLSESIAGFFHQIRRHPYEPVPAALLDLLLSGYHMMKLECWPTVWSEQQNQLVPADVQIDAEAIHVLLEAGECAWVAYQPNISQELLGRGLQISYSFLKESWSFEKWQRE